MEKELAKKNRFRTVMAAGMVKFKSGFLGFHYVTDHPFFPI